MPPEPVSAAAAHPRPNQCTRVVTRASRPPQLRIRDELRGRFGGHEWIDVVSKADLPRAGPGPPPSAICVSVAEGTGVDALRRAILASRLLTGPEPDAQP